MLPETNYSLPWCNLDSVLAEIIKKIWSYWSYFFKKKIEMDNEKTIDRSNIYQIVLVQFVSALTNIQPLPTILH